MLENPYVGPASFTKDDSKHFFGRAAETRELASLVIVMVTTETELGQMSAALEAGANEYIMKPFTKDILVEKLQLLGVCP